jgi:hypothetical protein
VISPKWTLKVGAKPAGGWEAFRAAAVAAVAAVGAMRWAQPLPPKHAARDYGMPTEATKQRIQPTSSLFS